MEYISTTLSTFNKLLVLFLGISIINTSFFIGVFLLFLSYISLRKDKQFLKWLYNYIIKIKRRFFKS